MNSLEMIHELYSHMSWADAEVWRQLLAHEKEIEDTRIRELLHHIHLVQHAYIAIWTGAPPDFRELSSFDGAAALAQWGRSGHEQIAGFVASIDPSKLGDVVKLPWADRLSKEFGTPRDMNLAETLVQIPMHSMNHRGQILMKMRELGHAAPILDFIAWVWRGKPDAVWPA